MPSDAIEFGIAIGASDAAGCTDQELYRTMLGDCEHAESQGFSSVWFFEHHFSDWYPTPSPTVIMSHVAARFPDLELGTCVLVLPWYEPLRLVEEVAMLSMLSEQPLHLGLGRGTAKYEFERFGLDMNESRVRYDEICEIVRLGLAGGQFTYAGEKLRVAQPVEIRPRLTAEQRDRVHFYGSVSNPSGAEAAGRVGLRPLAASHAGLEMQRQTMDGWFAAARANGHATDVMRPILVKTIVAETDKRAIELAQQYIPGYFDVQIEHYTPSEVDWSKLDSYKGFEAMFNSWTRFTDAANIPEWAAGQFVGSPDTVSARIEALVDVGFNTFLVQNATPGVPRQVRRRWTELFAREVAPRFSPRFGALSRS